MHNLSAPSSPTADNAPDEIVSSVNDVPSAPVLDGEVDVGGIIDFT